MRPTTAEYRTEALERLQGLLDGDPVAPLTGDESRRLTSIAMQALRPFPGVDEEKRVPLFLALMSHPDLHAEDLERVARDGPVTDKLAQRAIMDHPAVDPTVAAELMHKYWPCHGEAVRVRPSWVRTFSLDEFTEAKNIYVRSGAALLAVWHEDTPLRFDASFISAAESTATLEVLMTLANDARQAPSGIDLDGVGPDVVVKSILLTR